MTNFIIFAVCLYLIATNRFLRLHIDHEGVYFIRKKIVYITTVDGIEEREYCKIITLWDFKSNDKLPF